MEEVVTPVEDIDLDEEISITLESVSEYNICESEEIVWKIPHNYSIWTQRRISQNFCLLMKQR